MAATVGLSMSADALSSARTTVTSDAATKRAQALALKVPKPPERLSVKSTAFPQRPDMGVNTRKWVDDVKKLVGEAGAVVAHSQAVRSHAVVDRRDNRAVVLESASATETEARRRVDKFSSEIRTVKRHYDALNAELVELLRARKSATDKLKAVQKPLHDLTRRIEYRRREAPPSERDCDSVTRDLALGAQDLGTAVGILDAECARAERHISHMDDLATALKLDMAARDALLGSDANFVESAVTACLVSPSKDRGRGLLQSSDASSTSPRLPPVGRSPRHPNSSGSARPPPSLQRTGRNHPYRITDPKRIAELAASAINDAALVRQDLKRASKAVDVAIVKNTELVESSTRQTIQDTMELQKVLHDRMVVVERELAEVERQRHAALREMQDLAWPLEDNSIKLKNRKAGRTRLPTIPETNLKNDGLAEASARETGRLQAATHAQRNQLRDLDAQRERLLAVHHELKTAYDSKSRLLAVDRRVLSIGHTPRPSTIASGRDSVSSGRSSAARGSSRQGR
jgi:hypothetical protein